MTETRDSLVDTEFAPPRDDLERTVADIVSEVLGIDRIGRDDSFFDFGVTSMQAVRICVRIQRNTQLSVLPAWLFDHDVLADFVARVRSAGPAAAGDHSGG